MLGIFSRMILVLACLPFLPQAHAGDCSIAVLKTYVPRSPEKATCDDQNLPAQFAGHLPLLMSGLTSLGYSATQYDQCSTPASEVKQQFTLISQLGNCTQSGLQMTCSLYVAVLDSATSKVKFENTTSTTGTGAATLHLSEALNGLPACSDLK